MLALFLLKRIRRAYLDPGEVGSWEAILLVAAQIGRVGKRAENTYQSGAAPPSVNEQQRWDGHNDVDDVLRTRESVFTSFGRRSLS